ncbi:kinase-like domain-containing protein [Daedaleopsis nitida]|nr:kinase-like domain-containing protein [Daedaleopsis nitida]
MSSSHPTHFATFTGCIVDFAEPRLTLRFINKVGEGSFGAVYRAIDDSPQSTSACKRSEYAVKVVEKADTHSMLWQYQKREITAQMQLNGHPHIAYIYSASEWENYMFVVLELCDGDLLDSIFEDDRFKSNETHLKSIFVQLLDAVQHCHLNGIYHRDLKPENVLMSNQGTTVKLSDFGLATSVNITDSCGSGTLRYMSPECIGTDYDYRSFSNKRSEVWSLGVILTNLIARSFPWNRAVLDDENYRYFLDNPGYLREMLPISEEAADILGEIFVPDPAARISIPSLRQHILDVKTFFMSDEDVANGSEDLKAKAKYMDRGDTVKVGNAQDAPLTLSSNTSCDAVAAVALASDPFEDPSGSRDKWPRRDSNSSLEREPCPDFDSGSSSEEDSLGVVTPETRAQDFAFDLEQVPELAKSADMVGSDAGVVLLASMGSSSMSPGDSVPGVPCKTARAVYHPVCRGHS